MNRSRARPGTRLAAADNIRLPPVRQPAPSDPGRPPDGLIAKVQAAIVAETADYMVLSKPAGLAVHAGSGLRFGLIEVLRAARPDEYFELVHRLDRQTSGCLLVARNRPALTELRAGLGVATARKHYRALVEGRWRHGEIEVDAPLARDVERAGERVVTVDPAGGRPSLSVFRPLHFYAEATWMAVTIHTGRTHQIRVHAAHCGHPVAGDAKYGSNARATAWRQRGLARMALHAESVALDFRGHRRVFEAPLAADLAGLVGSLDAAR